MKWDGVIESFRQHMLCRQLCMAIRDHADADECVPFGCLHEEWKNSEWGEGWNKRAPGYPELRRLYAAVLRREKLARQKAIEPVKAAV
jgi:hypothetical protein